jgi:hypothetical protein
MDLPGRLPLPAKIVVRVMPKIDLKKRLGSRPDADDGYDLVTDTMQLALAKFDEERRVPVLG